MGTLFTTVRDTLRYKGREGQWLWVLHRISGLGILFYLILHVYDMSLAYFNVPVHEQMIALFKTPLFSVLELALAVLLIFHAVNGVRVALLDLRPELWAKQQLATRLALIITVVIAAPTIIIMIIYTINAHLGPVATTIAR
ncbi:MAG: succinate dehydrogenase, cytochrome b556 subunit [Chloroflexi bacterium]|nr:succinate dehydrogenase, cytochrome b556 subunit [Chloroflexota bacterium]MCL5273872.1 succinate dehydrogenase, cytochrome b556 subunit [Chloroflexota bacterium]